MLDLLGKTGLLEATERHLVLGFGPVQAKAAAAAQGPQLLEVAQVLKVREDYLLERLEELRLLLLELVAMATQAMLALAAVLEVG